MALVEVREVKKGIWVLELNRPEKLNALSSEFVKEIMASLSHLKTKALSCELRVLLLTSSQSKAFCAGADLGERIKMSEEQVGKALDQLRILADSVDQFPAPTIAVLEGLAFGGGLEISLACDLRVAAPSAQMGLTETRLAIIPGAGGTQRLSRIVGLAKAKELIYTAKKLSGSEAHCLGLVNEAVENPKQKALEIAEEIGKAGPLGILSAKKAISQGWDLNLKEALDWERKCYNEILHTQDRVEGLAAFSEKRSPKYQGK